MAFFESSQTKYVVSRWFPLKTAANKVPSKKDSPASHPDVFFGMGAAPFAFNRSLPHRLLRGAISTKGRLTQNIDSIALFIAWTMQVF